MGKIIDSSHRFGKKRKTLLVDNTQPTSLQALRNCLEFELAHKIDEKIVETWKCTFENLNLYELLCLYKKSSQVNWREQPNHFAALLEEIDERLERGFTGR